LEITEMTKADRNALKAARRQANRRGRVANKNSVFIGVHETKKLFPEPVRPPAPGLNPIRAFMSPLLRLFSIR
jgi:hypothetical protein